MTFKLREGKGQAATDYILVVAVLAIAIAATLASKNMRDAFWKLYDDIAVKIAGPS